MRWPTDSVRQHEVLANHTSFRIGGPAEWFVQPLTLDELVGVLRAASSYGLPVSVIGGGTNTLAADRGTQGLVIRLGRGFRTVQVLSGEDEPVVRLRCGSSVLTQHLVSLAARYGWGELETLAGLPGQIGGAVTMNAQGIGRFVQQISLVSFDGTVREIPREQIRFAYRYTALEPGIIAEVVLQFPKVSAAEASGRIRQGLAYRNSTQEVRLPSAGCAFRNPPGDHAGRLIDQAGLKGARIGDAMVS